MPYAWTTLARFKRPKAYRFVDALPKNNYGQGAQDNAAPAARTGEPLMSRRL